MIKQAWLHIANTLANVQNILPVKDATLDRMHNLQHIDDGNCIEPRCTIAICRPP